MRALRVCFVLGVFVGLPDAAYPQMRDYERTRPPRIRSRGDSYGGYGYSGGYSGGGHSHHGSTMTSYTPGAARAYPPGVVVIYYPVAVMPYGSSGYPQQATLHSQPREVREVREVRLYDNFYMPSLLAVPAGTLVRWESRGRHRHTVTIPGLGDSGPMVRGSEHSAYFPHTGTYHYYCRFHAREMKGTIIVY